MKRLVCMVAVLAMLASGCAWLQSVRPSAKTVDTVKDAIALIQKLGSAGADAACHAVVVNCKAAGDAKCEKLAKCHAQQDLFVRVLKQAKEMADDALDLLSAGNDDDAEVVALKALALALQARSILVELGVL